jgi:CobQ-like glutamine amidotransferase family enzyme
MAELRILHLYPDTLKLNGERGNVTALKFRAEKLGLTVRVLDVEIGSELPVKRPHIVFLGSGTLAATLVAAADLQGKGDQIHRWVVAGTKVLAVGSGFDLISQGLQLADGTFVQGLGLTNTTHTIEPNYLVGEVELTNGLAGFINSNRSIRRGIGVQQLGEVRASDAKALIGYIDGYSDGIVIASNVQGPLLPMNPKLADLLISWVYPKLTKAPSLKSIDLLATKARKAISVRVRS